MHKLIYSLLFVSSLSFAADKTTFAVGSTSFKAGQPMASKYIFNGFGCTGGNVSPEIHWANVPAGAKSLALTMYDPDAPTGSGWWHWTVFNIPTRVTSLKEAENFKPYKIREETITFGDAGEGRTDFGKPGYGGPCPPEGDKPHRYIYTLYAIKEEKLPLNKESSGAMVGFTLNANSIAKASFMMTYGRPGAAKAKDKK